MRRSLELSARKEETRSKMIPPVVRFEITEIKRHYDESISIVEEMFTIAQELQKNGNEPQAENIWRAQVVFIVSAFDFFMHEITKFGLGKIFDGVWESTIKYRNICINLDVLNVALKAGESSEWFIEFVNEQFATATMVSYTDVKDQINLLGLDIQMLADDTFYQQGATEKTLDKLKRRLNGLFAKRNVIAHQSDRRHADAEVMDIAEETVRGYIYDINNIVNNIVKQIVRK